MRGTPGEGPEEQVRIPDELPVLPLRDMVVYPFIIAPLSVAREIVGVYDGEIEIRGSDLGGACVLIRFPAD